MYVGSAVLPEGRKWTTASGTGTHAVDVLRDQLGACQIFCVPEVMR